MSVESKFYHHGDLKEALLDAAVAQVDSGERPTLRGLAREVGVSQTAPYRHFTDLDHLLAAAAVSGFRELERRLAVVTAADTFDLADLACVYVGYALDHPALFRLMFGEPCDDGDDDRVAATAALGETLGAAVRKTLPAKDPEAAATAAWALAHGLAMLHLDGKFDIEDRLVVDERVRRALEVLIA